MIRKQQKGDRVGSRRKEDGVGSWKNTVKAGKRYSEQKEVERNTAHETGERNRE